MAEKLTAEYVRSILDYDPETGIFVWKVRDIEGSWNSNWAGTEAGYSRKDGYLVISFKGKIWYAHRLAWLIMTGEMPESEIDHEDTNPKNCKWKNLRIATPIQNNANKGKNKNNTSGFKGVFFSKEKNKWMGQLKHNGKSYWCGYHDSPEAAHSAYVKKSNELNGEFARAA